MNNNFVSLLKAWLLEGGWEPYAVAVCVLVTILIAAYAIFHGCFEGGMHCQI